MFKLDFFGVHGITHWARVHENGCLLAKNQKLNPDVIELFAIFHDAQRLSDYADPEHGARGANLAANFRGNYFEISDEDFSLLEKACKFHSLQIRTDNPIIQACWDADRLDLGRLSIVVNPAYLSDVTLSTPLLCQQAEKRGLNQLIMPSISNWLPIKTQGNKKKSASQSIPNRRQTKSIFEENSISSEGLVLIHVARGQPKNGKLYPNIVFDDTPKALFKVPRVVVECCLNGVITGDPFFAQVSNVSMLPYDNLSNKSRSQLINIWPTGTSFLGPIEIPREALIVENSTVQTKHESDRSYDISTPIIKPVSLSHSFVPANRLYDKDKDQHLKNTLQKYGYQWMKIASLTPGFQNTTWYDELNGHDYLGSANQNKMQLAMQQFAVTQNIPNAAHTYGFSAGRFMSRLVEYFMCFQRLAFDTWWTNFSPAYATKALNRFKRLYKTAATSLTTEQRDSPAWKIVECYAEVGFYCMQTQVALINEGVFDLNFINGEELIGVDQEHFIWFLAGGNLDPKSFDPERIVRKSYAFRSLRYKITPLTKVYDGHPLLRRFESFVEDRIGKKRPHQLDTIEDVLLVWQDLVDWRFPGFDHVIKELTEQLITND